MPCPCNSQKPYTDCCGPILAGTPAPTAVALMRSRYTAFTQGNIDYLESTHTGPAAMAFNRKELERELPTTEWLGLTISNTTKGMETDSTGTVTFTATYRYQGQIHTQTETSRFIRKAGRWLYTAGK